MQKNDVMAERRKQTLFLTQFSLLLAIEAIICFTPLGSIPIGPLVATLMHVPVIITAINLGVGAGSAMGFFAGLFSFIYWSFIAPGPLAFVFTPFYAPGNFYSLLICFVPRILIGTVAGLVFKLVHHFAAKNRVADVLSYILAGAFGSLANTVLVLGGIYVFFGEPYAAANEIGYEALFGAIMGVIGTNGLLELAIGAALAYLICKPIRKFILRVEPVYPKPQRAVVNQAAPAEAKKIGNADNANTDNTDK